MAESIVTRTVTAKSVNGSKPLMDETEIITIRSRHGADISVIRDFLAACDAVMLPPDARVECMHPAAGGSHLIGLRVHIERRLDQAEDADES